MAEGIFDAPSPRYFSIASGQDFLLELARGLNTAIKSAGFALPDATVYLPTRRAARACAEAFLVAADGSACLTPRIKALGDIDEDEFDIGDFGLTIEDELALAPVVSSSTRRLVLARWVAEKEKTFFDGQRRWAAAISAADELGKLLDSLYTEEVNLQKLHSIVPERLAAHWQESLQFLEIITKAWPDYLAAEGVSDPAARRIALIDLQTRRWQSAPPEKPVIIAGTTGSTPAVARLMKCVASLGHGAVVLPGLDLSAPEHIWETIDEPHPQSGLKALLGSLGIGRDAVQAWPLQSGEASARAELMTIVLRPAEASDDWRRWAQDVKSADKDVRNALKGLRLIEARDEESEAAAIALKFREAIETPDRTAMLVTPDRDLARRVTMKMRRWGVNVDDSAGAPFANTPCGIYLRLAARWLDDPSDPVRVMALVDHPLFGGGLDAKSRVRAAQFFDRALRGLRPAAGMEGLRRKLAAQTEPPPHAVAMLDVLSKAYGLWATAEASFADRFEAHLSAAEMLSASNEVSGAEQLWRGDDGEAGAIMLASLRPALSLIVADQASDYADIFARLIAGGAVRRRAPAHPRLSILGPLEARLQTADLVILAGLNEGVWPRDAAIDPFLSRQMRSELGLPSPERRIGLAAHDFAQLTAAPEVVLTRSARAAGKPTKSSRWIVRLKNILKGAGFLSDIDESEVAEALVAMLDRPEAVKAVAAPAPRPPLGARPKGLSVTQIGTLLRDPYAIYASKILRLRKLDPLGEVFDQRYLGILFHKVLEDFVREDRSPERSAQISRLKDLFEQHAPAHGLDAHHSAFWRARAEEAFVFLADWDAVRRAAGAPVILEGRGKTKLSVDDQSFELVAQADRIDRLEDGSAYIVDYKSGKPPSHKQEKANFNPQLPLTGLIVAAGGFEELGATNVSGFEYVRVVSRKKREEDAGAEGNDARDAMNEAHDGLISIIRHFNDEKAPYLSQPRPQFINPYGDYDHLARRGERNAQGESDGGGEE
ncbi:double-strand break repair protein AddB [Hyphococcus sp.]|uniref:double-strand break repair protein AddB n=1 Tax=Hyphococcus sp. TaxID=2038636 RepID=UPI0020818BB9|nr:MAG: double-strand break repair protein AddB [Marinicaulis sp.]